MVSKVFEKLENDRIANHLEKCGLFSNFQYGFRSSRPTADLLTVVSDRIARAFNRSEATQAVALDIFKDVNVGKTQLVLFDHSNNNGSIDVKMDGSVLEKKSSFKMLGLTSSSKLDWGFYIISIAKTASKEIGALIRSMKLLSPEIALYLYKSTIRPCMEYCRHV